MVIIFDELFVIFGYLVVGKVANGTGVKKMLIY
jgi:hypothetical protein